MPSFVISTAFRVAHDKVSGAFKRMAMNADKFGKHADKGFKKASRSALNFKQITGGILTAGLISRGLMAFRTGVGAVTKEFIDFDQALTAAAAKFGNVKKGTAAFAALEAKARELGATTEFTAAQSAKALESMAMAGFTDAQAMASLATVTDLATGSSVELEQATSMAADALGAFNLRTKDSAQLAQNLTRINDVFAQTVTSSNVVMEDLFETMKFAGPVMTGVGSNVETFSALVRELGNAGIKGSLAGTALKNAYLNLSGPVPKASKLLKKLGVATKDADGNLRDMTVIIDELKVATAGMGTAQRSAALNTIFGKRAIAGMNVLLNAGGEKLRGYRTEAENAAGASNQLAESMRKSLQNRLLTLKSALIETGFKVIEAFQDKFPGALDSAIEAVRKFDVGPVIDWIKKGIKVIRTLWKWADKLSPVIAGVAAGFLAFKVAATIAVGINAVAAAFAVLAPAVAASSGAFGALGAIFAANPIGAIATAVALLVTAGVLLYQNWDTVKEKLGKAFFAIQDFTKKAWGWLSHLLENPFFVAVSALIAPWLTAAALIIKHWEPIKKFFIEILAFWEDILGIDPGGIIKFWKETLGIGGGDAKEMKGAFAKPGSLSGDIDFAADARARSIQKEQDKLTSQIADTQKKMEGATKKERALLEKKVDSLAGNLANLNTAVQNASTGIQNAPIPKPRFGGGIKSLGFAPPKPPTGAEDKGRQGIDFAGKIDITGAPPGTKLESKTRGAPPIQMNNLGTQGAPG